MAWSTVPEPEDYVTNAGMGATGRYLKDAPNAADFQDDKEFRGAMLAREMEKRAQRRASGQPMGNAAANSYMNYLTKPSEPGGGDM